MTLSYSMLTWSTSESTPSRIDPSAANQTVTPSAPNQRRGDRWCEQMRTRPSWRQTDQHGQIASHNEAIASLSLLHAPFVLGLITGGAVIYWFTGASIQAVTTGAYRAVEFIKANIKLDGVEKASTGSSKKVVEICTKYAQKGMLNIFLTVFFSTLAFAFVEPFFFIGYLISIAIFGLYQAIFMANAGGASDNAKKIVEVEMKAKNTPLHDATIVGDTVGDPYKDTSSVALNPVIKFTTLFGLLAVELAISINPVDGSLGKFGAKGPLISNMLAALFFAVSLFFVHRSFYGMRIEKGEHSTPASGEPANVDMPVEVAIPAE